MASAVAWPQLHAPSAFPGLGGGGDGRRSPGAAMAAAIRVRARMRCSLLSAFGIDRVHEHIGTLKSQLRDGFARLGFEIITPVQGRQSGIITIRPRDHAAVLYEQLTDSNIVISLRSGCLRFSPHFYNTQEEVATILDVLANALP